MGSCLSRRGRGFEVTKSRSERSSTRKSSIATHAEVSAQTEEAIVKTEKTKETLEEEIDKLQQQIQETR